MFRSRSKPKKELKRQRCESFDSDSTLSKTKIKSKYQLNQKEERKTFPLPTIQITMAALRSRK